jgi:hypothetical protein
MQRNIGRLRARTPGELPAMALDFLTGGLDSRVTYSGAANGTRINEAGIIVPATTPRFDYNPVTLAARGLWVEETRTNLVLNSATLVTQSVEVTAVAHVLTFYGTGTVTLTGVSTAGPAIGSGAYPAKTTLSFAPTAGTLTLTVAGSVTFAQLEAGAFATSYIPTTVAPVTRTADSAVMTGTNFSDWFNASAGTFVTEVEPEDTAGFRGMVSANDTTSDNCIQAYINASNSAVLEVVAGAATQAAPATALSIGGLERLAIAYATNDFALCANGGAVAADAAGTVPTVTQLNIGTVNGTSFPFNGHIRSLSYFRTRLPNATLQALTA